MRENLFMDSCLSAAASPRPRRTIPPLPPVEYRRLVCHDDRLFDVDPDKLAFPGVAPELYESVFDFGCGCGREARQLLCQPIRPRRYVGIDIHRGMIRWCIDNLTPIDPNVRFFHHDVFNLGLAPDNSDRLADRFPVEDGAFTLVNALSVFTHIYKEQSEFYLSEIARILAEGGLARTTWFFFDKQTFPMMFDFQVCLYINEVDPTNAVVYDWRWFLDVVRRSGLRVSRTVPPSVAENPGVAGHQWLVYLEKRRAGSEDHFLTGDMLQFLTGSGAAAVDAPPPASQTIRTIEEPPAQEPAQAQTGQTESRPSVAAPVADLQESGELRLRYTGRLGRSEFENRCREAGHWYHSYYFDNGFAVRGDYDIGRDIEGYGFPKSMAGMRVLDVGTAAGWFAHYFEQKGAEVHATDARGYGDFDVYGRPGYLSPADEGRGPDRFDEFGGPVYHSPVSSAFWAMKEILGSGVRFHNARIYDLTPELFGGRFDLVFLGTILCQVRDPIGALVAARRICTGRVIATTHVKVDPDERLALPRQYLPYTEVDRISWWLPNETCFRHWFLAAGFRNVSVEREVLLRSDVVRTAQNGRAYNPDQSLRVGTATVG
jgi:SAM-dependent methyltransferase